MLDNGEIIHQYINGITQRGTNFYDPSGHLLSSWEIIIGKFVLLEEIREGDQIKVTYMVVPSAEGAEEQIFTKSFTERDYNVFCASVLSGMIDPRFATAEA